MAARELVYFKDNVGMGVQVMAFAAPELAGYSAALRGTPPLPFRKLDLELCEFRRPDAAPGTW